MSRRRGDVKIVRENGVAFVSGTADGTGFLTVPLNPSNTATVFGSFATKLNNLAEVFELYRFTKLQVVVPSLGTGAGLNMVAFNPVVTTVTPTSNIIMMDQPWSWLVRDTSATATTTQCQSRVISKKLLFEDQPKWFRTQPTTYDDNLEYQGAFFFRGFNSAAITCAIHYWIEFSVFVNPAQTPLRRALVVEEKEDEDDLPEQPDTDSFQSVGTVLPGRVSKSPSPFPLKRKPK